MIHVLDMNWLPIGPEVAIDTGALSAARRGVGEKVNAAARDTAQQAEFDAEAMLIETETPIQQVAEVIARESSRWGADLVVTGTHGRRGFQRLILGSVAERMTRLSSAPVLLIPSPKGSSPA